MFLLSRLTCRGGLRSAVITRLFAMPLRLTGPHHSRRGLPLPSFYFGQSTRVLPLRLIPQELFVRRSPGYLSVVVELDAVFDPGVSAPHSSYRAHRMACASFEGIGTFPIFICSRGYVSDSGLHPSPRPTRLFSFPAFAFSHYATERLTTPYSGGPVCSLQIPSQQATIARSTKGAKSHKTNKKRPSW